MKIQERLIVAAIARLVAQIGRSTQGVANAECDRLERLADDLAAHDELGQRIKRP